MATCAGGFKLGVITFNELVAIYQVDLGKYAWTEYKGGYQQKVNKMMVLKG